MAAPVAANSNADQPPTVAERLIAAAATSPEVHDWIARQLMAGRKPSEILVLLSDRVLH
ncbi:hypothetical protein [Mesorhizobium sp.]|uniref:hypothetical protein n=1 Tax=Mesorhizobium sp. TaxID=1871066 RepID=UPI0025DC6524|nr:hypothetical protein [Mesorhizobium sp.]